MKYWPDGSTKSSGGYNEYNFYTLVGKRTEENVGTKTLLRSRYIQRWLEASESFVAASSGTRQWAGTPRIRTSPHVSSGLSWAGCQLASSCWRRPSRWPAGRAVTAPGSPSPSSTSPSCWSAWAWWRSVLRRWSCWRSTVWTLSTWDCPWWWSPISTLLHSSYYLSGKTHPPILFFSHFQQKPLAFIHFGIMTHWQSVCFCHSDSLLIRGTIIS